MNWTDIESKWDAMTRRVQSDRAQDDDDIVITRAPERSSSLRHEADKLRATPLLDRTAT